MQAPRKLNSHVAREILNPAIDYLNAQRPGQGEITGFKGVWVQRQMLGNNASIALTPFIGTVANGSALPRTLCNLVRGSSSGSWKVTGCAPLKR